MKKNIFKDKVVIVTGASTGIGRAIAKEFARHGSKVVLAARSEEKLRVLENEIKTEGGEALICLTDVAKEDDCRHMVEKTVEKYGTVNILINNAGISMRALFSEVDLSVLKRLMDVNFWGTVYCTKFALPYLIENMGSIVAVSSVAGFHGLPGRTGYSASKFAIHGFLETVRIENLKNKLHVMIIAPGFTSSDVRIHALTADGSEQGNSPREEGRMMSPEHVAKWVLKGIRKKKRNKIMTWVGRFTALLQRITPGLVDRAYYEEMKREPASPLKQTNCMADIQVQIRNKLRLILKCLPEPVSESEKKSIKQAIEIAIISYPEKLISNGKPLIMHYMELARIAACEMGLGSSAVVCALLSGIKEDSPGWTEVENLQDAAVKSVIKGLSRVMTLKGRDFAGQAENFRKLLLTLADDGRVILITLAERLLMVRSLDEMPEKERLPVASETYFLYAPLAHRLGYYSIKSEMEDLAMKLMEPDEYKEIESQLRRTATSRNKLIKEFSEPLRERLDSLNIRYELKSRTKSVHSIWQKMKSQGVGFEEVFDIFAIRIIIDAENTLEKSSCWQAYSVVTDLYQPNPSRMRDWISVPKSNGYESLHTTVVTSSGKWVEVQIRTVRMDEIAEKGLAAHFRYKGLKGEGGLDAWMAQMREVLGTVEKEGSDFLGAIRPGLYADEVFVFTPKGEVRQLPLGATLLDFAFDIHTEIGSKCVGGKVNGRNVQLKHKLQNGDHVSVTTNRTQSPKRDWLAFVITNKARSRIKQALNEEKVKLAAEGKEILTRRLKNWKIPYGDATVMKLLEEYGHKTAQDLYFEIAIGEIDLLQAKKVLLRSDETTASAAAKIPETIIQGEITTPSGDYLVIDERVEGLDYKLSKCCNPVFGDRIFGFVTVLEGIKIHRMACPNAEFMLNNFPYRVLRARWTRLDSAHGFLTSVKVTGVENLGIVARISDILSEYKVSVKNFSYKMDNGLFEGRIELLVPNVNVLYGIIKKIQSVKGITRAMRIES